MSRIRLSDNTLIDTDEVVFSSKRDDDTRQGVILGSWIPQTFVILRGGCQQILTGEEKAVFDAWAAGERESEEAMKMDDPGTLGLLYECDGCAWLRCAKDGPTHPNGIDDACFCSSWELRRTLCESCQHYSGSPSYYCVDHKRRKATYPRCYEADEKKPKPSRAAIDGMERRAEEESRREVAQQHDGGLCDGCDALVVRSDGLMCTRNSGQLPYPECHTTYSAVKDGTHP